MASVLFSTVGQAVGGPLGTGVGAAVGAAIDRSVFRRSRGGASDLYVQRSQYGAAVPRLFGTSRVAGALIWALPPANGGQRKGGGRRAVATSFAVGLSSGPILGVRRIWADGREIRNAEGVFETAMTMRVHSCPSIAPDPLIVASEGVGSAPAFQGLSYLVLENFGLAPFGNRIPNLSFEVVADESSAGMWLASLASGNGFASESGFAASRAQGYAASSDRLSDDLSGLAAIAGCWPGLRDGSLTFRLVPRSFDIPAEDVLAVASVGWGEPERRVAERPASLAIEYLDPARDYQIGRQRVARSRPGHELASNLPLSATADVAQELATALLREAECGAERLTLALGWRWLDLAVGDAFRLSAGPQWRVTQRDIRGLLLRLEAQRVPDGKASGPSRGDPGRALVAPAVPATPTIFDLVEPPVPIDGQLPELLIACAGDAGWRGAEISLLANGIETLAGSVPAGRALGRLVQPLFPGTDTVWDERATLEIEVDGDASAFQARSEADVLAGANLILVEGELLQFRTVTVEGQRRLRLGGLLRNRFGTGSPSGIAPIGAHVFSLTGAPLPRLPVTVDQIDREVVFLASSMGDPVGGTAQSWRITGAGLAPLSAVHVNCGRRADGRVWCSWIPRNRTLWQWRAGADPDPPTYLWHFAADDGRLLSLPVVGSSVELSPGDQQSRFGDQLPAGAIRIEAVGDGPAEIRFSDAVRLEAAQ